MDPIEKQESKKRLKNKRVKRMSGACHKSHLGKFDEIFAMNFTRR